MQIILKNENKDEDCLEATELWFYRMTPRRACAEHVTKDEVLRKMETKCTLILRIRKKHLSILEHNFSFGKRKLLGFRGIAKR